VTNAALIEQRTGQARTGDPPDPSWSAESGVMRALAGERRVGERWWPSLVLAMVLCLAGAGSAAADPVLTQVGPPTLTGALPSSTAFSPNGRLLATANSASNSVSVFSVSANGALTEVGSPTPTGDSPLSLSFSSDGRLLATANSGSNSVSVFSVSANGALTPVGSPIATDPSPALVVFSPVGNRLAIVNWGDIGSVSSLSMFSVSPGGALTPVGSVRRDDGVGWAAFSRDGKLLATVDEWDSISVFSVSPSGALTPLSPPTSTVGTTASLVALSPTGEMLAIATKPDTDGASVSVFSVSPGGAVLPLGSPTTTGDGPITSMAFGPNGGLLATTDASGLVSVFSVSPGGALTLLGSLTVAGIGEYGGLTAVPTVFGPDGRLLATLGRAGSMAGSVSMFSVSAPSLDTSIISGPPAATAARTATFTFDANYPSTFECRLDNGSFASCATGVSYAGLAEGRHTLAVRAKDLLGNIDASPASRSWRVDLTAPAAASLAQPADAASNLPASTLFSWSSTSDDATGISRYELWIDGALSQTVTPLQCAAVCAATPGAALADGSHRWQVRAVDSAGNVAASVSRTFAVDAAPPAAFALAGPDDDAATTDRRPALLWQAASDAGIGLAGYDIVLDGQVAASVDASTTAFTPGTDLTEGTHDWQVVARDAHGNRRASATRRFTVDVTQPVAKLTAAPDPALVGRIVTFDGGASSDAGSGVVRFEWDLDGDGSFERDTGATATTTESYSEPGVFGVQLRVTDRAGLSAVVRSDQRISAETRASSQFGISINDGARYTNDPKVTIKAIWPSFASQMLISNDGGFKTAQTLALQADTPWTLDSSGAERLPKIVYVRFVRGLTISETYTDDIILDESAPAVTSARVSPSTEAGAAQLALRARDRGLAGVSSVQVSNNRRHPHARFRSYHATIKLTRLKGERQLKTGKPIYVRVRDRAGNLSAWRTAQHTTKRTARTSHR
jgi:DNA-binding beta-propeller fold protein YncE